jgi:hypothetical protein
MGNEATMDWQQVVLNGGPPCFHVEGPQYCGRAERWAGHGNPAGHNFVSLSALLTNTRASQWQDERERLVAACEAALEYLSETMDEMNPDYTLVAQLESAIKQAKGK